MQSLLTRGAIASLRLAARSPVSSQLLPATTIQPFTRNYSANLGRNYYDVLEVHSKASPAQVKAAYYRLSKKFHPDVNKTKEAEDRFAEISVAYEVLGNPGHRRHYDQGILNPLDIGTGRSSQADMEYEEFLKRGKGFKVKQKAPRGRSFIYNFDEFYREHYEDVREKQKTGLREKKAFEAMDDDLQQKASESNVARKFLLALAVVYFVNYVAWYVYQRKRPWSD